MSNLDLEKRASHEDKYRESAFFLKGHLPLYSTANSVEELREYSWSATFRLFLWEIFSRSIEYSFLFPLHCLHAGFAIVRATIFNLVFILGGFTSDKMFYLTGRYNQLAIKSVLFLLFDTSAFLLEYLQLLVGLFIPSVVLNSLGEKIDFDRCKVEGEIDEGELYEGQYLYYVYCIGAFLQRCGLISMSMVVMSLLCEPVDSIVHGMRMLFSSQDFKLYGANPDSLDGYDKQLAPILFLHGAEHDQSAFVQLLYDFRKSSPQRPLFTVKLPEVYAFADDEYDSQENARQDVIDNKILEIQSLYETDNIEPIIIGHSAGADAAVVRRERCSTQQMYLLLGANARSSSPNDKYITARNDEILCLESEKKQFASTRDKQVRVKEYFTGHLGLLTDPKVIQDCVKEVNSLSL